jgi:hypothetical protein
VLASSVELAAKCGVEENTRDDYANAREFELPQEKDR